MKKAAVIGLGDIAQVHVPTLLAMPDVRLVALCDIDPTARKGFDMALPFYTDFREMVEKEQPDCVHVCLPHYLHYPVSQELARMGVHLFCEKPLALNTAQAEQFAALEGQFPKQKFGICLQNRMNETVEELRRLLDSGEYGKVTGVRGMVPWFREQAYYAVKPWRGKMETAGGGCMINQAIHTLDLMYYLGGEIAGLRGSISQLLDYGVEVEDTACARLDYRDGATGLFTASVANSRNEGVELAVATERGEFLIRDETLYRREPDGALTELLRNARLSGSKFYYGASHAKLIARFYRALEQDTADYIHISEGVMSIRLIDAIRQSSAESRAVTL